jgi:agmatine/peptidylarginine deiminase
MSKLLSGLGLMVLLSACAVSTKPPSTTAGARSAPHEPVQRGGVAPELPHPVLGVLAGEWEPVERVVIGWNESNWEYIRYYRELLRKLPPSLPITVVSADAVDAVSLAQQITFPGAAPHHLDHVLAPVDTMWVRDYGPLIVRSGWGRRVVDLPYDTDRPQDDEVPQVLGRMWSLQVDPLPIDMEGGHIQADGEGRCVITDDVLYRNSERYSQADLERMLFASLGCRQLVVVPALVEESTGHVDMFLYLSGPGRAIVGRYQRRDDALNHTYLEDVAGILTDAGFDVVRMPMPRNDRRRRFRTYTNALAVNDVVVVPTYRADRRFEAEALRIFRQQFPGRRVVPIRVDDLINLAGAVHCTTITIPADGPPSGAAPTAGSTTQRLVD